MVIARYETEEQACCIRQQVQEKMDSAANTTVDVVVHITALPTNNNALQGTWKAIATDHMVLPPWNGENLHLPSPFTSAHEGSKLRSQVHPTLYPETIQCHRGGDEKSNQTSTNSSYILIPRAKRGFVEYKIAGATNSIPALDVTTLNNLDEARELAATLFSEFSVPNDDSTTDLIFTGTGAAVPCKHRNVTGMLLRWKDSRNRSILLDVGEGTMGQLLRMKVAGMESIQHLSAVWVSHPHADHHLGLIRLLHERRRRFTTTIPLWIVAPTPLLQFLQDYAEIDPSITDLYRCVDSRSLVMESDTAPNGTPPSLRQALGGATLRAVPVTHCSHAYALVLDRPRPTTTTLKSKDWYRVVFSGDCRPSYHKLTAAGSNCDILIHEATFETGLEAQAVLKKHCTVGEAVAVAHIMKAKTLVLTHYSQRYPKIFPLPEEQRAKGQQQEDQGRSNLTTVHSFDFMRLTPQTEAIAAALTPALQKLYPGEDGETTLDIQSDPILAKPGLFAESERL